MTVTGRTYTSTRARGFAPWNPQTRTKVLLEEVQQQLELWDEQVPVTIRQLFYGLIGRGVIGKDESAYAKLCELLNRGRRAGMIPWTSIRDDGPTLNTPSGFDSPEQFVSVLRYHARNYRRDRQARQAVFLELWCEAAGMLPQLVRVADPFGVPVASCGGFDSVTAKFAAAQRFCDRDVPTVVLHIGDLDPSGCSIIDSAAEDITSFCDRSNPGTVSFRRLAVTPDQVVAMALPAAPPKAGDRRGEAMAEAVQAEAIPPAVLAEIVVEAISAGMNMSIYEAVLEAESAERDALIARVGEGLR